MKKILYVPVAFLLFYCTSKKEVTSVKGAYEMLSQSANDGKMDTSFRASQVKIYTDSHIIYAGISADSVDYFGIGEYTLDKGKVNETVFFTSGDSVSSDQSNSFQLEIEQNEKGYKQVIRDMATATGKVTLTEAYQNASTATTSPLDGAWKATKMYWITNGDTVAGNSTQFKVYESGNFVFAHSYADSIGRKYTGIGYGTYEKVSDNQIKETLKVSTYNIAGRTFEVNFEMIDPTHYRQTLTDNGTVAVEEYEKLVKQ